MKLNKPLSEYTTSGLLFVGRRADDPQTAAAVLEELRRRQQARRARWGAPAREEVQRARLDAELEIEGLRSLDLLGRRAARRALYAAMTDRALDRIELPAAAAGTETVRTIARTIDADTKTLYDDRLRAIRQAERARNRQRYEQGAAIFRAEKDARNAKNQRVPIIGEPVRIIRGGEYVYGRVLRYRYRPALRLFVLRIETSDGDVVERTIDHVTPTGNVATFRYAAEIFAGLAAGESAIVERDKIAARIGVYREQLARLDKQVADYETSGLRREWGDLVVADNDEDPETLLQEHER